MEDDIDHKLEGDIDHKLEDGLAWLWFSNVNVFR